MSEATLLKSFDLLASSTGGVARLRELILTLAVQGKLVPQDPKDEPASELLKRIRTEKDRLIAEGKIKRDKPLSLVSEDELPFALPQGWDWVRLGALLPFRIGKTPPSKDPQYWGDEGHAWVSISDMPHFGEVRSTARKITNKGAALFGYEPLPVGTLIMSFKLTIGKISVLRVPAYHNEAIASFMPLAGLDTEFLKFTLPIVSRTGASKDALMGQTLNTESLSNLIIALPPKAEQARIVARVEELRKLCDALDAKDRLADEQHTRLTSTLFDALANSESAHALAENWKLVAEHFDLLLDRPEAVDALEQTILQLAVRGLLVPQDPKDEPASELLKKIRAEKDRLIANGEIKRDKPLPTISEGEQPFVLPASWEWVRLSELMPEFQNGASSRGDAGGKFITVLRLADIKNRRISLADTRQIPIASADIKKYQIVKGDILITRVNGSADIVGQFNLSDRDFDAIYCDHFIRMRLNNGWISSEFCALLGESDLVRSAIKNLFITTAGQKTVNQAHIGSLTFGLPPLAEQTRIVVRVESLRRLCADLRQRLMTARSRQAKLAQALVEEQYAVKV